MRDTLSIGPTPTDESCEQLGPNYNPTKARRECRAFVGQLRRIYGDEPEGVAFRITSNPHDFGSYYDVVVSYDDAFPDAVAFAFDVESHTPARWDAEAIVELSQPMR